MRCSVAAGHPSEGHIERGAWAGMGTAGAKRANTTRSRFSGFRSRMALIQGAGLRPMATTTATWNGRDGNPWHGSQNDHGDRTARNGLYNAPEATATGWSDGYDLNGCNGLRDRIRGACQLSPPFAAKPLLSGALGRDNFSTRLMHHQRLLRLMAGIRRTET